MEVVCPLKLAECYGLIRRVIEKEKFSSQNQTVKASAFKAGRHDHGMGISVHRYRINELLRNNLAIGDYTKAWTNHLQRTGHRYDFVFCVVVSANDFQAPDSQVEYGTIKVVQPLRVVGQEADLDANPPPNTGCHCLMQVIHRSEIREAKRQYVDVPDSLHRDLLAHIANLHYRRGFGTAPFFA